ncbi:MAG: tetraacyldisaccharide 4'-kinase [Deltaproteobacteria bacterium]|nr:tetraacyldisaccharide 4'-kinase [Deltaproteobacteria bacterium]
MRRFKKKIEAAMMSEDKYSFPSLASWLYLVSIFYGAVQNLRESCYRQKIIPSRRLPCKVISVGNITVGGTGKTPMTMHVAAKIHQAGYSVAIVSRGYKGRAERSGGIVSDGRTVYMDYGQSGDEPYMMACRLKDIPVIVGKKRFVAGMMAVSKFKPDVIVLDDGFQHLKLVRDVDLVLLDHKHPFGNSHLLPRGTLREPISSLARSTACILTGFRTSEPEAETRSMAAIKKYLPGSRLFASSHVPYCYTVPREDPTPFHEFSEFMAPHDLGEIKNCKVFGFSGIARNDAFQQTVRDLGFNTAGYLEFSDHHDYSKEDLEIILHSARAAGAQRLITTEKDHVRIADKKPFPLELIVIGVKASFKDDQQDFISFIKDRLKDATS